MQNEPDGSAARESAPCPRAPEAAAFRRGGLSAAEHDAFERHCGGCAPCRALLEDFDRVEAVLRARPSASLDADFASRVLAALREEGREPAPAVPFPSRRCEAWRRILKIAACLALCAGALLLWLRIHPGGAGAHLAEVSAAERQAIGQALDWLARTQEKSGAWDVAKWQGSREYKVGLTGMALLALAKESGMRAGSAHADAARKALDYLARQQDSEGAIGPPCSGRMYNHGIATVAMLEAYGRTGDSALREPIGRALKFIQAQQSAAGGWGYDNRAGQAPNTSISFWQLQALQMAGAAGIGDAATTAARQRGLRWLGGVIDGNGLVGYQARGDFPYGSETLTAMGAVCLGASRPQASDAAPSIQLVQRTLQSVAAKVDAQTDFYRTFFLARAARVAGGPQFEQPLARLRQSLIASRNTTGSAPGSWEPVGAWSPVGGRIYSTAMAALSLQASRAKTDIL